MLTVENISFGYRNLNLFEDVSFKLESGQLLLLSGANGTGKSTLLSILAGFKQPKSGKIDLINKNQRGDYLGAECNHLFLKKTAIDNLKCWRRLHGKSIELSELKSELKRWNLDHPFFSHQLPVERFSTGMKRRLALARISLSPKKLWFLDEPLFGLDVAAIEIFRQRLVDHTKNNGSVIMVSHDQRIFDGIDHQVIELARYKGKA
ncbi:ATP-binding cassette domain-containing protein [Oligoflexaceae bacterium]|nr:ATP-binding cassette domain-containing protein [Oligoflexaceae bacterium]